MSALFIDAEPYPWPHDGGLRPETTALLIIDMQRDFCEPGGYMATMGYDLSHMRAIVSAVYSVRNRVREWGGTVVYTREGHRPDLADLPALKAWRSRRGGLGIGGVGPMGKLLIRGELGWEIVDELRPAPGEIIIDKSGYSAFYATDLEQILNVRGIRHLIFTGVTTDVCVHSTLRDAVDRNYECLLIGNACAASNVDNHRAALRTIVSEGGIFGAVTSTDCLRLASPGDLGNRALPQWSLR